MTVVVGTTYKPVLLSAVLGSAHLAGFPDPVYLALSLVLPAIDGTLSEPTDGAYARLSIPNDDTNWPEAGGQCSNAFLQQFATATVNWGTIAFYALMDSPTTGAGSLIFGDALTDTLFVSAGMAPYIAVGQLIVAC
jgi:hypothetical protein